jgi:hypothetical protein
VPAQCIAECAEEAEDIELVKTLVSLAVVAEYVAALAT